MRYSTLKLNFSLRNFVILFWSFFMLTNVHGKIMIELIPNVSIDVNNIKNIEIHMISPYALHKAPISIEQLKKLTLKWNYKLTNKEQIEDLVNIFKIHINISNARKITDYRIGLIIAYENKNDELFFSLESIGDYIYGKLNNNDIKIKKNELLKFYQWMSENFDESIVEHQEYFK